MDERIVEKIKRLYVNNQEMMNGLLNLDGATIKKMPDELGFLADEVIYAYENNKIDELYKQAKRQKEIKKLYKTLIMVYYANINKKGK